MRTDTTIFYQITDWTQVSLSFKKLLDEKYIETSGGVYPGAPFTVFGNSLQISNTSSFWLLALIRLIRP